MAPEFFFTGNMLFSICKQLALKTQLIIGNRIEPLQDYLVSRVNILIANQPTAIDHLYFGWKVEIDLDNAACMGSIYSLAR